MTPPLTQRLVFWDRRQLGRFLCVSRFKLVSFDTGMRRWEEFRLELLEEAIIGRSTNRETTSMAPKLTHCMSMRTDARPAWMMGSSAAPLTPLILRYRTRQVL